MVKIKWLKMAPDVEIPYYKHDADAGFDIAAYGETLLYPWERKIVSTKLKVEIPRGYEMQIRPRSGLSVTSPLLIANSPGTIDSGYRGEIGIIVLNASDDYYIIKHGSRIAQGVIVKIPEVLHVEVDRLSDTERDDRGFGSTGL